MLATLLLLFTKPQLITFVVAMLFLTILSVILGFKRHSNKIEGDDQDNLLTYVRPRSGVKDTERRTRDRIVNEKKQNPNLDVGRKIFVLHNPPTLLLLLSFFLIVFQTFAQSFTQPFMQIPTAKNVIIGKATVLLAVIFTIMLSITILTISKSFEAVKEVARKYKSVIAISLFFVVLFTHFYSPTFDAKVRLVKFQHTGETWKASPGKCYMGWVCESPSYFAYYKNTILSFVSINPIQNNVLMQPASGDEIYFWGSEEKKKPFDSNPTGPVDITTPDELIKELFVEGADSSTFLLAANDLQNPYSQSKHLEEFGKQMFEKSKGNAAKPALGDEFDKYLEANHLPKFKLSTPGIYAPMMVRVDAVPESPKTAKK